MLLRPPEVNKALPVGKRGTIGRCVDRSDDEFVVALDGGPLQRI